MNKVSMTVSLGTIYKRIKFWNGIFDLTSMELEVLSNLINISDPDYSDICSLNNKKKVAEQLGIEDHNTLNNYVKKLKDKGAIKYANKKYTLPRLLDPEVNKITIKII
jgi:hypothetical protein